MNDFNYLSIDDITENEKYPFTIGQMRMLLLNRNKNGLAVAVRKIGKRLYVRSDLFDSWIDSHNEVTE